MGSKQSAGSLLSPPKNGKGMKGLLPPPRKRLEVSTSTVPLEEKNFTFDASFNTFSGSKMATNVEDGENLGSRGIMAYLPGWVFRLTTLQGMGPRVLSLDSAVMKPQQALSAVFL